MRSPVAPPRGSQFTIGTSDNGAVPALTVTDHSSNSFVTAGATGNLVTLTLNNASAGVGSYSGFLEVSGLGYMDVLVPYTLAVTQPAGTYLRGGQLTTQATGLPGPGGSGGPFSQAMGVGDFNEDGFPDIASGAFVCGGTCAGVYTRKTDGTGYNYPTAAQAVSTSNTTVVGTGVADFNQDGHLDAAFVTNGFGIVVGFGDGTGALTSTNFYPSYGSSPNTLKVADLNNDGYPDIVISNSVTSSGGLIVMINDGAGKFVVNTLQSAKSYYSVAVADFNGDGVADLAAMNQTSSSDWGLDLFLGLGGGRFGAPQHVSFFIASCVGTTAQCTRPAVQTAPPPSAALVAGDFNGDGIADLAFIDKPENGQPLSPAIVVALASVDASHNVTFNLSSQGPIAQTQSNPPYYLTAGDVDGDGNLDLVWERTGAAGSVELQFGAGDGSFGNQVDIPYSFIGTNVGLRLADLDGDGLPDLAGPVVAGDSSGSATAFCMGAKVATSMSFNGVPVSAASLSSSNINFQGTLTLFSASGFNWVRGSTVPVTFYDSFPTVVGSGLPSLSAPNRLLATRSGTVSNAVHAFEARFPGDGRMLPSGSVVYAPNLVFQQQPTDASVGSAILPDVVVHVNQPSTSARDLSFNGPVSIGLDHGAFSAGVTATVNASGGLATFSSVKVGAVGAYYLTAMAGSTLVNSNTFNIVNGAAASLVLTGLSSNVTAGVPQSVQVQIQDSNGLPAGNFTGTVHFTSTDSAATLPADYTFTPAITARRAST